MNRYTYGYVPVHTEWVRPYHEGDVDSRACEDRQVERSVRRTAQGVDDVVERCRHAALDVVIAQLERGDQRLLCVLLCRRAVDTREPYTNTPIVRTIELRRINERTLGDALESEEVDLGDLFRVAADAVKLPFAQTATQVRLIVFDDVLTHGTERTPREDRRYLFGEGGVVVRITPRVSFERRRDLAAQQGRTLVRDDDETGRLVALTHGT